MDRPSLLSSLRRGSALLVLGLGAASIGCGGIGPGDYLFYSVSFSDQEEKTPNCFEDSVVPPEEANSRTTFRDSRTWVLYASYVDGEDKLFLDMGDETLAGFAEGDALSFEGEDVDVTFSDIQGTGDKITDLEKRVVKMTLDGVSVSGSVTVTESTQCAGNTCEITLPVPENCTTTTRFAGSEIEDVALQHDL
jgi:hypothetical protein